MSRMSRIRAYESKADTASRLTRLARDGPDAFVLLGNRPRGWGRETMPVGSNPAVRRWHEQDITRRTRAATTGIPENWSHARCSHHTQHTRVVALARPRAGVLDRRCHPGTWCLGRLDPWLRARGRPGLLGRAPDRGARRARASARPGRRAGLVLLRA